MGLLASEVPFTLPDPTILAVIPHTVPLKVGLAKLDFKSKQLAQLLILENN